MYRSGTNNSIISCNFICDGGGLGDLIARIPAWKYVYDNHPQVNMLIWVQDFGIELTKRSLPIDKKRIHIRGYSQRNKFNKTLYARHFSAAQYTNLASHMTDHAFATCVNVQPEDKDKNYLSIYVDDIDISRFNLPEEYVVVTTGYTSDVREWNPKSINETVDYIKSRGYEVVFLGKTETYNGANYTIKGTFKEEIDYSKGINLIDNTDLLETTKIIYGSKTIVGSDNGLLHLAATHPELPIIGGFTTVLARHRMPYRHNILGYKYYPVEISKEKLACVGCQSNCAFWYGNNFTQCFYKDYKCVELLTSDLFIEQLEKIL